MEHEPTTDEIENYAALATLERDLTTRRPQLRAIAGVNTSIWFGDEATAIWNDRARRAALESAGRKLEYLPL